jgi:eukaryotic-like serine/threonine-protein kinase
MKDLDLITGQVVSHYRVLGKLGAGGMGLVYKGEDGRLRRFVALKFLSSESAHDAASLERFRREAQAASALNHPNICTIYDIGEADGRGFIAMEFLDGLMLKDFIASRSLQLAEILDLGLQITDGLDAAHQLGIVHRDIKSTNIFVTKRGRAKILDFGLAKLSSESMSETTRIGEDVTVGPIEAQLTRPGTVIGTVAYMSPEQIRGELLDARTDIFSFGIVLYEMATGHTAFPGATSGVVMEAILNRAPAPLRRLVAYDGLELERIVTKALQKDRNLRYQRAADIHADLLAYKMVVSTLGSPGRRADSHVEHDWHAAGSAISTPSAGVQSSTTSHSQLPAAPTSQDSPTQARARRTERVSKVINSLAVLPFENATRDPENEYLSDGIAGSLINIMATLPKLRVMAQSTVFRYKGGGIDPQAVGRELNVRAVLTGRIMHSGESLRIGAELVDVATGSQLWGAQYHRKLGDIFSIQDEISNEISEKLRLKLTHNEKKRLSKRPTTDAEAYSLYLKGRHHWDRWTEDGFYKAIEYFQLAIERDPNYALAYCGVSDAYVLLGWNSYLPAKEAFPKAKIAAMRALRLDSDLGEAHTPLAAVFWLHEWEWKQAQAEFQRSLALNPSYPTANHWFAEYLMTMGRQAEAIEKMKSTQELDPLSLIISVAIGWANYMARRYDQAIEQLRRTVELEPHYPVSYWILGIVLRKMGQLELAINEGEKGVKLSGGSPLMSAALAQTLASAGERAKAIQILDDLANLAKEKYVSPYFFAGIHICLGEHDRAMEFLEQCYNERCHWLIYLHIDPCMDPLRSNPRFRDLLGRIGLPLPPIPV